MFTGSKKILLDTIKRNGTVTINEITGQTDLSKTTLREHLLQLERDGYIRRTYLRKGPGRPKLSFKLTTRGQQLYPSSESELLRGLLRFLKSEDKEEIIEQFFINYWDERHQKASEKLKNVPRHGINEKINLICEMLEEEGFMPEYEIKDDSVSGNDSVTGFDDRPGISGIHSGKTGTSVKIRECNCPFSQAIRETRLPCKLEAMFYERLFHQKVERTSYIAEGDHTCTYEFKVPS